MERVFLSFLVVLVLPFNILLNYSNKSVTKVLDTALENQNYFDSAARDERMIQTPACERYVSSVEYVIQSNTNNTQCDCPFVFEFLSLGIYTDSKYSSNLRNFLIVSKSTIKTPDIYSFIPGENSLIKFYDDSVCLEVSIIVTVDSIYDVRINSKHKSTYEDMRTGVKIDIKNECLHFGSIDFVIFFE